MQNVDLSNLPRRWRELAEAEAKMTSGNWRYEIEPPGCSAVGWIIAGADNEIGTLYGDGTNEDGHGIALARNSIKPLLDENMRLREALKQLKERIHFIGMPQEQMYEGRPDWRKEITIIEAALEETK